MPLHENAIHTPVSPPPPPDFWPRLARGEA